MQEYDWKLLPTHKTFKDERLGSGYAMLLSNTPDRTFLSRPWSLEERNILKFFQCLLFSCP